MSLSFPALLTPRAVLLPGLLLAAVLPVQPAKGGASSKTLTAVRTLVPPVPDGIPDEPQWLEAPPATDFTQFDPDEGAAPTESTMVRILYDDNALYLAVRCFDHDPAGIIPQLTRRDRTVEADRFTVQIDSYHDHQTAFVFSTNISGVQSDGVLSQDGIVYDIQWDAVWEVRTRLGNEGWSAEFVIPFHALRFAGPEAGEQIWGINFRRYISRKRETLEWVMVPRTERAAVSLWGQLEGIHNIRPPLHLAVVPYVSGRSSFETVTDGRPASSDQEVTAGLDLKYGLTRGFTLDATINPDFGQVEVDQAVLNLTVFETLFPEKRPFFTESSQIFSFGPAVDNTSLPLFFSRRIGKRPSGSPFILPPPGGSITDNPQSTTILGAAKLSGRTLSGFSLGALVAATDEEEAEIRLSDGSLMRVRTEPQGIYQILRLKQEIAPTSWIGGILTGVARENMLPAYSAGVDWNLRLDNGRYAVDGYLAGAAGSAGDGKPGMAGRLLFSRISSEHWFYTAAYDAFGKDFRSNDVGFFAQPHDHGGYAQLLYRENFAARPLRRYFVAINPELRWNWDGIRTVAALNSSITAELANFWALTMAYAVGFPAHDDAERGLIGIYRRPLAQDLRVSVQTDERSSVSGSLTAGYLFDARGKAGMFSLVQLKLRPASWLDLTPSVYYQTVRQEWAGVLSGGGIATYPEDGRLYSLFGDRDIDELDLSLRGTLTFTTTLSMQAYGQVLLARGNYTGYGLLAGDTYFLLPSTPPPPYDFNFAMLNANLLLRWEYMPGSTLYLVWTQGRFGDSRTYGTGFGTRFGETLALPHEDVLVLKINYWFPL